VLGELRNAVKGLRNLELREDDTVIKVTVELD